MLTPNRSHPQFFKKGAPVLPVGLNETSFFLWNGELLSCSFNRPPLAIEIIIHRVSDQTELARWAWNAAFGTLLVDDGVIHIFGSTQPSDYVAGNWVVHSTLDPVTFQPSFPVNVYQAPVVPGGPYTVPNTGVCKSPVHGYVMAVDLMSSRSAGGDGSQGRTIFLKASSLSGPWTRFGEPFSGDPGMVGAFKPFYVPGGAHPNRCYMVYNSSMGGNTPGFPVPPYWMNLAYTDDFCTFTPFSTNRKCYVFPDAPIFDGFNSSDGSEPVDLGNGTVVIPYMAGDQQTWSEIHLGRFDGTLASLVAAFGF